MELRRIWAVYTSPTGNTDKVVNTLADDLARRLELPLERISFTRPAERAREYAFAQTDLVLSWWAAPPMPESCPISCCRIFGRSFGETARWPWQW